MSLSSASIILRAFPLLYVFLSLSGCLIVAGANLLTHDVECEAMRSDRERGVVDSTALREKHCEEVEKARVEDARKIVEEAEKKKQAINEGRLLTKCFGIGPVHGHSNRMARNRATRWASEPSLP